MDLLLDQFTPGAQIYIPGATGEIQSLSNALKTNPDRAENITFISCVLPGINTYDYSTLSSSTRLQCFLLPPQFRPSFEKGHIDVLPITYFQIARYLADDAKLDIAVAHAAYPDKDGACSLGICADFSSLAWRNAPKKVLVLNDQMPSVKRGPKIAINEADLVLETSSALCATAHQSNSDEKTNRMASYIAELVPDGASLQFGIGQAPTAAVEKLVNHKDLKIVSGMITQSICKLFQKGAVNADNKHIAGIAFGEGAFYSLLSEEDFFEFAPVSVTHNTKILGELDSFFAINSALEVDLFGQANLEWRDGKLISGIGGASNFAHGARLSPNGRSTIVLPSTAKGGSVSRIVLRLSVPALSLSKTEIDTVVTEHGVADLRNRSIDECAKQLINIAAPEWREQLNKDWHLARSKF